MPCNLAVAITRAALTDEKLKTLIDAHLDQVTEIMASYLARQYRGVTSGQPGMGLVQLRDMTLQIKNGSITVTSRRGTQATAEKISTQASTFLQLVGDQLFTQEVERTLSRVATLDRKQVKDVDNRGVPQRATIYSLHINGLSARVFVLPNARLQVFIDDGSFEQAKTATLQLLQQVRAQGLEIQMQGSVEQHRDGVDHVHIREAQRGG